MSAPQPLSPPEFPLSGSRLIEASAGTGKTYTIAALYVRLVLQHGGEHAFHRFLMPPEILVVTFTEAATRELRDRIRARLVEAARVFRGQQQPDAFLARLQADYPAEQWPACAYRLDNAAQWMDEAAIQTIHAWCQRMLREHAFASGSLFDQEVQGSQGRLYLQVVRDYWRQQCYPLAAPQVEWVRKHWGTPQLLWQQLARPVQATEVELPAAGDGSLQLLLQQGGEEMAAQLAAIKQPWLGWVDELEQLAMAAITAKQVDGRKLQAGRVQEWLQKLRNWCQNPGELDIGLSDPAINRLTPDGWSECWKAPHLPPQHPALDDMQTLPARLAALASLVPDRALWHAARWVRQRFAEEKQQRAEIGFNDMLLNLQAALHSPRGAALAAIIRQQFPVALIDEFQDTDPVQYDIFDRVYRLEENDAHTGLFLIGDPKQAIYSFRGADIHTYLKARAHTSGRHYSLDTNFRSSQGMVDAVNRVFLQAEDNSGSGAFLFRQADGDNPLPFVPVRANGRKEAWQAAGQPLPALTFWRMADRDDDKGWSKEDYRQQMAQVCASEIVRLLNDPGAGYAADGSLQRLAPGDIAVLVRDRNEARAVREALLQRQVRSVYLSDKDSVYASREAQDVQFWLAACLQPEDERALKAALASSTLGLSLAELDALQQDELLWEQSVLRFKHYQQLWQQQGVLPMLRQLLHDYNLPQRLHQALQGERALTNLLHLSEVLQQAARELDGQAALLEFLQQAHADPSGVAEEQVLRLESDAALVRVVTIHKSKGMEYPLVFLPFICSYREAKAQKGDLVSVGGERRMCQTPDEPGLQEALERERLAEDLRLLYVALTRSRHACWLGVANLNQAFAASAIGHVLGGDLDGGIAQLVDGQIAGMAAPLPSDDSWQAPTDGFVPQCRPAPSLRHEPWWIASYSALDARGVHVRAPESQTAQVLQDDERDDPAPDQASAALEGIHAFARGARPGTFLHVLLEKAMQTDCLESAALRSRMVENLCRQRGYPGDAEMLAGWLETFLATGFRVEGREAFCLGALDGWQNEMEFWFASHHVSSRQLDELVQEHVLPGLPRPALLPTQVNGMFKGFIDLLFVQDGRYYLADYKSNWLGNTAAAYTAAAMDACVLKHRYDLQYALYSLALHRLLRSRLPGYSYERDVGGVAYLFLRGVEGREQGLHFVKPPLELIERLDDLFCPAGSVATAG